MSYKIADFTNKHKVSLVQNGSRKYASAVKIGNTNKTGWVEPTTPTEKNNIHTYLDLNGYHPTARNICLKSKRLWSQFAWDGKHRTNTNFSSMTADIGKNLQSGHPSFTNRTPLRSFGNAKNNNWGPSHKRWYYDGYSHCEFDRKNIPYVGEKYNVSFWMRVNNDTRDDTFYYNQNNYNIFKSDIDDLLLRLVNNLSSNQLRAIVYPKPNTNTVDLVLMQKFMDWGGSAGKVWWWNGIRTNIPVKKWIFINVAIDGNKAMFTINKNISSTKQLRYEDVLSWTVNINRKSWKKAEYKNMSAGRDTNFNNSSDAERLHAIGVCSNNLQVADFRVIANKSMINDWKNICHIQNHREQFGDLPKIMHTAFAPDLADEAPIDFSESEHNNNFSSSLYDDLSFAQNENNSFDSREDILKKISDENSIDLQFLNEQIFEQNEMQNIDYLRILENE